MTVHINVALRVDDLANPVPTGVRCVTPPGLTVAATDHQPTATPVRRGTPAMSDNTSATPDPAYVPQRGDRVRWSTWGDHVWVDVKHVEDGMFYGPNEHGVPVGFPVGNLGRRHWVKVTPPPKRYIVELRAPKKGERYVNGFDITDEAAYDYDDAHFVIVGEA